MGDNWVTDLINKLRTVNHITGLQSIIDLCNEAADYISAAEKFKSDIADVVKRSKEKRKKEDFNGSRTS